MEKKLFTNQIKIATPPDKTKQVLANPTNLLNWVPEITLVDFDGQSYMLTRKTPALNGVEKLQVVQHKDTVIYQIVGTKAKYQIEFEMVNLGDETLLNETVIIDSFDSHLPLELFVPIAKHALNGNLKHLRDYIELT